MSSWETSFAYHPWEEEGNEPGHKDLLRGREHFILCSGLKRLLKYSSCTDNGYFREPSGEVDERVTGCLR